MNLRSISNRDAAGKFTLPTDGWFHLVPRGEFAHPESGLMQVLDAPSLQAMVNRFTEEAKQPNFAGLLIDADHFSYDPEKSSEAYGWIKELQNRADGIWGRIEWTPDLGEPAVKNGRYRFVSPVWLPRDVEKLGNKRVRPLRLDTAGLTNQPNLRGMVPLSNRKPTEVGADRTNNNKGKPMKSVCTLLGLSADAEEASVHAEVTKLKNRIVVVEDEAKPLRNRITELETDNKALLEAQVEADLAKYANRIKADKKDAIKAQLIANRAGTIAILEGIEAKEQATTTTQPMHNRRTAGTPATGATEGDEAAEQKRVRELEAEIDTYRLANRCSYDTARNVLRSRKPELFGIK